MGAALIGLLSNSTLQSLFAVVRSLTQTWHQNRDDAMFLHVWNSLAGWLQAMCALRLQVMMY